MPFAAFDIEIAKQTPDGVMDLMAYAPLGITCAALAIDGAPVRFWQGDLQMSTAQARELVASLQEIVANGYTLLTWNGCAFDFQVLAQESGMRAECGQLALNHVDFMLIVTYTKGYRLGLEAALKGAGLAGKVNELTLSDGRVVAHSGAQAPALWAAGEHGAVLAYLKQDVAQLLALGNSVAQKHVLNWTSGRGNPMSIKLRTIPTVRECDSILEPDTSWMSHPPTRKEFVGWIRE